MVNEPLVFEPLMFYCMLMLGVDKSRASIYRAAWNGMAKRFNPHFISLLGTLDVDRIQYGKQSVVLLSKRTTA